MKRTGPGDQQVCWPSINSMTAVACVLGLSWGAFWIFLLASPGVLGGLSLGYIQLKTNKKSAQRGGGLFYEKKKSLFTQTQLGNVLIECQSRSGEFGQKHVFEIHANKQKELFVLRDRPLVHC